MNWIKRKLFRIFRRKDVMLLIDIALGEINTKDFGYENYSLSQDAYELIFDMPFKKIKKLGLVERK